MTAARMRCLDAAASTPGSRTGSSRRCRSSLLYYGAKRRWKTSQDPPNVVTAFIGHRGGQSTFWDAQRMTTHSGGVSHTRLHRRGDVYCQGVDVVACDAGRVVFQKSNVPERACSKRRVLPDHTCVPARMTPTREELSRRLWDGARTAARIGLAMLVAAASLCIARALAVRPDILLMDEPAPALDPIATQRIEELIYDLKKSYTIVIVTHNMQQAARVSDHTAFFWLGRLVEYGRTEKIFTAPSEKLTEDYLTGRFG